MDPQTESGRKKLILSASLGIALALAAGSPAAGRIFDGPGRLPRAAKAPVRIAHGAAAAAGTAEFPHRALI